MDLELPRTVYYIVYKNTNGDYDTWEKINDDRVFLQLEDLQKAIEELKIQDKERQVLEMERQKKSFEFKQNILEQEHNILYRAGLRDSLYKRETLKFFFGCSLNEYDYGTYELV